ncbi:MAG: hypothetical protein L3J95_04680 [Thermoplasmata archaeon]|nr:hypothetical protein [Thermoplasmata archaeon]MCI4359701.1 hypothetical protein [Thermoplasmata archaeon]
MLVLIVVTAATALAAFVANYQKSSQSEQALAHQRALENLRVIDVAPLPLEDVVAQVCGPGACGTPGPPAQLTVNAGTVGSVSGSGFVPGDSIVLTFGGVIIPNCISGSGLTVSSGVGTFSCGFVLPPGLPSPISVTATDSGGDSVSLPVQVEDQTTLSQVRFTLASLYIDESKVTAITLNGQPLSQYCVDPPSSPPPACANSVNTAVGGIFAIASQHQVIISANVTSDSPYNSSFFYHPAVISGTSFLKIEVFTSLGNDFVQSFVPPTAIAVVDFVETSNGMGGFTNVPVLDGSLSLQPGNETIVTWTWMISETPIGGGSPTPLPSKSGEKVAEPTFNISSFTYAITLTVANNDGLYGSATVSYP